MEFRDYAQDQQLIQQFLEEYYTVDDLGEKVYKYKQCMENLANRDQVLLVVELTELKRFNEGLYDAVVGNTTRYEELFSQALDELLPKYQTKEDRDIIRGLIQTYITDKRTIIL